MHPYIEKDPSEDDPLQVSRSHQEDRRLFLNMFFLYKSFVNWKKKKERKKDMDSSFRWAIGCWWVRVCWPFPKNGMKRKWTTETESFDFASELHNWIQLNSIEFRQTGARHSFAVKEHGAAMLTATAVAAPTVIKPQDLKPNPDLPLGFPLCSRNSFCGSRIWPGRGGRSQMNCWWWAGRKERRIWNACCQRSS